MEMLMAQEQMNAISSSCFSDYEKKDRSKIWANLKKTATLWLDRPQKSFYEVALNLARRLKNG
jgi:hypothetical protein